MKKIITALTATAALTTYGLADQAEASSYKVQSGDTLWKIANQNSVSVSQLKSWNNLSSDLIFINQNLKTSGSSSSSSDSSSSKSSSSSQSSSSSSSSSSASGTYTVKSGDTLSKIARANGMNYRTLMNINNISSHIIHPGQKLSLGGNASSSSNDSDSKTSEKSESKNEVKETSNNSSSASSSSSNTSSSTYSVKAGDTLSKIARAHGTTYRNIMNLNNMSSTVIHPGQSLKVSGTASTSSSSSSSSNDSSSNSSASESKETVTQNVSAPAPTNVSYGKNYYTWGECTWYVFERRQQLGKPVGNGWGNAYNWDTGAKSDGYKVNNSPSVGAIMQADAWTNFAWGMGHVAVVERINSDGSILVSEMNFGSGQGVKAFRTISASQVSGHNFIH
ncbi:LysM peptidoglycan-binding domain-containing protein [Salinicoccus hispanicus]|uniref:LysM peptidoglycan-binding domain-containing protein n=1 Tax=Salinicoccus hispanicus TaxID=157225 RepID=A0A6N8TY19_9STAP|nr:LysM peptidoglycan-binding domain-containing protein [Salinicoccus hispanicus]MXQ50650.1 LysM peptidoglycan-binding domain-containing protein [Salinicoccus hispanicus]